MEEKTKGKDIWVISPDLSNDTGPDAVDIIAIVKKNLRRKITYTYIVPDTESIKALLPGLSKIFGAHSNQLKIIKIPQNTFQMMTAAHIVIYNPNMDDGEHPLVFLELPINERGYGKGFWVKTANDAALAFIGRFRKIVEDASL